MRHHAPPPSSTARPSATQATSGRTAPAPPATGPEEAGRLAGYAVPFLTHAAPSPDAFRPSEASLPLPEALAARLAEGPCDAEEALLAALAGVLFRYTDYATVCIGRLERLDGATGAGWGVHPLVLRPEAADTFGRLLRSLRHAHEASRDGALLPPEAAAEAFGQPPPFPHVLYAYHTLAPPPETADRLAQHPPCLLALHVYAAGGAHVLRAVYDAAAGLEAGTAERLLGHVCTLLASALDAPDRPLHALDLLTPAEQERLPALWGSPAPAPDASIHGLFEEQARAHPEATALAYGAERYTYETLDRRSSQLAAYLRGLDLGEEARVGVCLRRTPELVVALLGVLKAGAAYVPLDPAYPPARLAHILADAEAGLVLSERALQDRLPPSSGRLLLLDDAADALAATEAGPLPLVAGDRLAYVIYTSGSTGRPKGVAIEHRNAVARIRWVPTVYGPDDLAGVLASTSVCFDLSVFELFGTLCNGGTVVLADHALALPEVAATADVRLVNTVPSAARQLLDAEAIPASVRTINLAGEFLPQPLVEALYAHTNVQRVFDLYGPSEDTTYSTAAPRTPGGRPSIGRPLPGTRAYVLDRHRHPVPLGVPGELYLGGVGVASGYLGQPEQTAERFLPDPFAAAPGSRMYRTGDRARMRADGALEYLGRHDHQVKVRGYRIELGEIEAALRAHPGVAEAVAAVHARAENDHRLVAYVVPTPEARADVDADARVAQWGRVFDAAYERPQGPDPTLNAAGYVSSYTGEPIPAPEMRAWADAAAERALALRPRRVLELGCGTGMVLFRVAPHTERYVGADPSPAALRHVEEHRSRVGACRLDLLRGDALEALDGLEEAFDLVLLNGVIQYFPGADYLREVIAGALRVLAPGGHLFLGDVRSLPLREALHTSVVLHRSAPATPARVLQRRLHERTLREEELLLDPAFFRALPQRFPAVRHVDVLPKEVDGANELVRFRYDVLLHTAAPERIASPAWRSWHDGLRTPEALAAAAQEAAPHPLGLRAIPYADLAVDAARARAMQTAPPEVTAAELAAVESPGAPAGTRPADLAAFAEAAGLHTKPSWARSDAAGTFDCVLWPASDPHARFSTAFTPPDPEALFDEEAALASDPARRETTRHLVGELREALQARLPAYMVPSLIAVLDALPLTPNGKVDRQALPDPDTLGDEGGGGFHPPRDAWEVFLCDLWAGLLGVERVGITDDFFDLGGHSILAAEMLLEVERRFGRQLPLGALAEASTVAALAALLREEPSASPWSGLAPIQTAGSRTPLFWVFGRIPVLRRMAAALGEDQPLYGLQWQGIDGDLVYASIEAMADYCLERVRTVQPTGPYVLGGLCLGGLIALEMAQRLRAAGERVDLLALVDTPTANSPTYRHRLPVKPAQVLADARRGGVRPALQNLADRLGRSTRYLRSTLAPRGRLTLWWCRRTGRPVPPKYRWLHADLSMMKAARAYQPQPYDGSAILFRSEEEYVLGFGGYWTDDALGFSPLLPSATVHKVPTAHEWVPVHPDTLGRLGQRLRIRSARGSQVHGHEEGNRPERAMGAVQP